MTEINAASVPAATGSDWRRHNEFGGVIESISAADMAKRAQQTIDGDAKGWKYTWGEPDDSEWGHGETGWRYEFDPDYNRISEAMYVSTRQFTDTSRIYTRPKGGAAW